MARYIGLGGGVYVNPDHVASLYESDGKTVVVTPNRVYTTDLTPGEVVDLLEAEPVVL